MRNLLSGLVFLTVSFCFTPGAEGKSVDVNVSEVGLGYSATSVNTAVFRANSLTSRGDTQYICFYNPEGRVTVGRRKPGSSAWELSPTQYNGNVADAHNVISMAVDGDGYLHLSFDHHGNSLRYCRSVAPDTLAFGELEPMIGSDETDVTYPEFHSLPDGSLIFVYRSGASGRGNMVMNRYDTTTRSWQRVHDVLIDGEGKRNAYWQLATDAKGTIHLSWVWRETWLVETNHDLCYACSKDGGKTWQRSDGTPYKLPITTGNAEVAWSIPQNSELINQTSMTADRDGNPMIATYWRDSNDSVPNYRLVSHDGKKWNMEVICRRQTPFSLSGGGTKMIPVSRPQVVTDGDGVYYMFRDAERGSKVSMAMRDSSSCEWEIMDLTDFSVDAWEPTFDKNLWLSQGVVSLFVQKTSQGDGERVTDTEPQPIYVYDYNLGKRIYSRNMGICSGRVYSERNDDLAWENDVVAFRAYGPTTQRNGERSFGYDIFFKYPGEPVLDVLYGAQCSQENWDKVRELKKISEAAAKEFEDSFTYHIDHGKGMDCFAVGPTLGAGVAALVDNDSIVFPWCYSEVEILENGPEAFRAKLTFNPVKIGNDIVVEEREISLVKGSHLNKCVVRYNGLTTERKIVFGFPRRDESAFYADDSNRFFIYNSPTQGEGNGIARLAIVCPDGIDDVVEMENHIVGTSTYHPGTDFTYYWGYDWDKISGMTENNWKEYLLKFSEEHKNKE